MDNAKVLFEKAQSAGKTTKPYLALGNKDEETGAVVATGPHIIKLVSDSLGKGTDPFTGKERDELHVVVLEGGVEKMWNIPVKNKDGNLHYLVQRLAEFKPGDELVVEMKRKGMKNYIEVKWATTSMKAVAEKKQTAQSALEETVEKVEDVLQEEELGADDVPF